jgi:glutaredoxin-like protein
MIDEKTAARAKELLGTLDKPVKLIAFTQELECSFCRESVGLVEDVSRLSELISHEVHDFVQEKKLAKEYGIDKIPATVVAGDKEDYGIRFFGIPSGYEFVSFLDAIKTVSTGMHDLTSETLSAIGKIKSAVHLQVFVTPTCPYCPKSVILAHKLAFVSEHIQSDMIEAIEFPQLSNKYKVVGVPKSIINEKFVIEGAVPEKDYVDGILKSLNKKS